MRKVHVSGCNQSVLQPGATHLLLDDCDSVHAVPGPVICNEQDY